MSDLDGLVRDLDKVARVSPKAARTILQDTAKGAKTHWRDAVSKKGRIGARYGRAITYNTFERPWGAEGEIGARLGGAGSLGLIDDPIDDSGVRGTPVRARRSTEKFIEGEFEKHGKTVVDVLLRDAGL